MGHPHDAAPQRPSGTRLGQDWATDEQAADRLNLNSCKVYLSLWDGWLNWLLEHGIDWSEASDLQVTEFLSGPNPPRPNRKRGRKPINRAGNMANYTRQRYWRVLRGVYAYAQRQGYIETSPVLELEEEARPSIEPTSRVSQVLPVGMLKRLRDHKVLFQYLDTVDEPSRWEPVRDVALVCTVASLGLTTDELASLTAADLVIGETPLLATVSGPQQLSLLKDEATYPLSLQVPDGQRHVDRTLPIPKGMRLVLLRWLSAREQRLRTVLGSSRSYTAAQWTKETLQAPLFISQKLKPGAITPMLPSGLYFAVRRTIQAVAGHSADDNTVPNTDELHIAKGAAIVRNSVIAQWLEDKSLSLGEVMQMAGLKSAHSLRLPLPPERQAELKAALLFEEALQ